MQAPNPIGVSSRTWSFALASASALMAVGRESASTASDETLSSGKAPVREQSTRAWAICAAGDSALAMACTQVVAPGRRDCGCL